MYEFILREIRSRSSQIFHVPLSSVSLQLLFEGLCPGDMDVTSGSPLLQMKDSQRDNNKNCNQVNGLERETPEVCGLIKAVRRGIRTTVKYLNDQKDLAALNIIGTDLIGRNVFHLSAQREDLLEFLLEVFKEHPNLEKALRSEDINGNTPAHLAALNNARKSVQMFVAFDKSLFSMASQMTGKSLVHCAVESGNKYMVQYILEERPEALFDKDISSRSPQHYAAALKDPVLLEYLLSHGVDVMEADKNGSSALHVAAEAGSISNVKLLVLDDVDLLKLTDNSDQTALHVSCKKGHRNIASFLLESGADPLERDSEGCTALECAVTDKQQDVVEELLLSDHWRDLVSEFRGGSKKCFATLVENMPQSAQILLDRCVQRSKVSSKSEDYSVTYDFVFLQPSGTHPPKFDGLSAILEHDRENCLMHNLCQMYLSVKWREKGYKLYCANIITYLVFHVLFNTYVMLIRGAIAQKTLQGSEATEDQNSSTGSPSPSNYPKPHARPDEAGPIIATVLIVSFTIVNMIKELFQMYATGWNYFKYATNYFEWILYTSVLIFMFPVRGSKTVIQFGFGSIAVFFSWFDLIWFMRRVPDIGTYILTLQRVFKTLVKMLLIIILFCMAFSSTFYLLLAEYNRFRNFPIAVLSTFVSMLGDFAYDDLFVEVGYHRSFYSFKIVTFIIFILLMGVVVNNVLIGLAVGDTDCVMKQAKVQRLRQQAKYIMEIERSLLSRISCFKMNTETIYTEYPNQQNTFAEKIKNLLFGQSNLFCEDDENNKEEECEIIIEERVEKVMRARLDEFHKQMIQDLKDFQVDIMERMARHDKQGVEGHA